MKRFGFLKLLAAAPVVAKLAPIARSPLPPAMMKNAVVYRTPSAIIVQPNFEKIAQEVLRSEWTMMARDDRGLPILRAPQTYFFIPNAKPQP